MKSNIEVKGTLNGKNRIFYLVVDLYSGVCTDIEKKLKKKGFKNLQIRVCW